MDKCFSCGVSFEVTFEEADADLKFCPHCGQAKIDDIELVDQFDVDPDLLYDEEDQDLG